MRSSTLLRMLLVPALLAAVPVLASNEGDTEAERYGDWGGWGNRQDCIMYEVRPGDYCYKIATDNGIPYAQFLRQNPGIDCTNLRVGQSVCLIPLDNNGGGWGGLYARQCKTYTVRSGDACTQIAQNYDISVADLIYRNEGSPGWRGCSRLQVGQQLCV